MVGNRQETLSFFYQYTDTTATRPYGNMNRLLDVVNGTSASLLGFAKIDFYGQPETDVLLYLPVPPSITPSTIIAAENCREITEEINKDTKRLPTFRFHFCEAIVADVDSLTEHIDRFATEIGAPAKLIWSYHTGR